MPIFPTPEEADCIFLILCLQMSDCTRIDFDAVSSFLRISPRLAESRFLNLRDQAVTSFGSRLVYENTTGAYPNRAHPFHTSINSSQQLSSNHHTPLRHHPATELPSLGGQYTIISPQRSTPGQQQQRSSAVVVDLTKESDGSKKRRNEDGCSDDGDEDMPLMKKRKTVESVPTSRTAAFPIHSDSTQMEIPLIMGPPNRMLPLPQLHRPANHQSSSTQVLLPSYTDPSLVTLPPLLYGPGPPAVTNPIDQPPIPCSAATPTSVPIPNAAAAGGESTQLAMMPIADTSDEPTLFGDGLYEELLASVSDAQRPME